MSDNNFIREDPWRIFRIMAEFVDSFQTLSQVDPAVTIFWLRARGRSRVHSCGCEVSRSTPGHLLQLFRIPRALHGDF